MITRRTNAMLRTTSIAFRSSLESRRRTLITRPLTFAGSPISQTYHKPMKLRQWSPLGSTQVRTMFIQTEQTPNEDSLKFIPGVTVLDKGTAEFLDARSSMVSPLAKTLFHIDGVGGVFFGPDFITISKVDQNDWSLIKPEVFSAISDFFASGQPIMYDENDLLASDTAIHPGDSEEVQMIKELLDTRIRPAIQEDGGDIEFCGFDDGVVKLKLKGSCRGCSSSTITLKNGIENMLMHYIPEVQGVEQVLDETESASLQELDKLEKKLDDKD